MTTVNVSSGGSGMPDSRTLPFFLIRNFTASKSGAAPTRFVRDPQQVG
jgi:hypothetical protein